MKSVELDYQNGNIGKLFRSLFFPTLIGMLCNSVFLITDGIFVGQGIGPSGLAAVNMVAPIFILICGIALMFGIGSSVGASISLALSDWYCRIMAGYSDVGTHNTGCHRRYIPFQT